MRTAARDEVPNVRTGCTSRRYALAPAGRRGPCSDDDGGPRRRAPARPRFSLRDESEILGQHRRRRLEVGPGAVRIDDRRTVAGEERRDLLLRLDREQGSRPDDVGEERVRVMAYERVRRNREIVAEQRGPPGQMAGTQD